jgi:hypothetical protein
MKLAGVLSRDDYLFLRYRRAQSAVPDAAHDAGSVGSASRT